MKLVTVYRTFSSGDAHLVCSRLEASNLQATVTHELAALSMEGYAVAAGGILVQVPEDQAAEAKELIELRDLPPNEADENPSQPGDQGG